MNFFPSKNPLSGITKEKEKHKQKNSGNQSVTFFSSESERSVTFILAFLTSAAVHTVQATTTKAAAGVIATSTTIT